MANQEISVDGVVRAKDNTWAEAEKFLVAKDTPKFLGALSFQEVDYEWVEVILQEVTALVNAKLNSDGNFTGVAKVPGKVQVVPRGSFASRTALRGHVDLDLDLVFPENFNIVTSTGTSSIADILGGPNFVRHRGHDVSGNLIFTKDGLKTVLGYVWTKLVGNPNTPWLTLAGGKTLDTLTSENSFAQDETITPFKIRDFAAGGGALRNGTGGDIKIKSHHLLTALNALHEVEPTDPLYIPRRTSLPFSLVRVIDVMAKILTYLDRAYHPPQNFLIVKDEKWSDSITKDNPRAEYVFPLVSCGPFDTLFKQFSGSLTESDAITNSGVIPKFIERLKVAQKALLEKGFKVNEYVFEESFPKPSMK